jgi:hypothetical protein
MPAANLSDTEKARVNAGKCACGCGNALPDNGYGQPILYFSEACKQRAFRNRRKEGRVIPRDARQREADRLESIRLEAEALEAEKSARYLLDRARSLHAQADRLRTKWDGQTFIPGTEPRRAAGG